MAELPNTIWVIVFGVLHNCSPMAGGSSPQDWDIAIFDCELDIDDGHWQIKCDGGNTGHESDFLIFSFEGLSAFSKSMGLKDLLNSTRTSKVYYCNMLFKAVIHTDWSAVIDHCREDSKYAPRLAGTLRESHIKRIQISNVPSLKLVKKILSRAVNLSAVTIYNTSLSNITSMQLAQNNSVQSMTLRRNAIKAITGSPFRRYPFLRTLDLADNYLNFIGGSSFDGLNSISTLDLSYNLIKEFHHDLFSSMLNMEAIFLQNNKLALLSNHIFDYNKKLNVIDISNNNLKALPAKIFYNLPELTNISCSYCNLTVLDKDLFKKSPKLLYIRLDHNILKTLPCGIFSNLKYLKSLNLGFNALQNVTKEMFNVLHYLRLLNLTSNDISNIEKGSFDNAPAIAFLDLSRNKLDKLNDEQIRNFQDLEFFDLRHNRIELVELGKGTNALIRKLFLSHNCISKLDITWKRLLFLEVIDVDDNLLTSLEVPPCIPSIKQTITFSFKNNIISSVGLDSLLADEARIVEDRKLMMSCYFNGLAKNFVDLTQNPLNCDCSLYPFFKYAKDKIPRKYQLDSFLDAGNLTCATPLGLKGRSLVSLEDDALVCSFDTDCPELCRCGIRGKDNMTFANCSGESIQASPRKFPDGTTVLYFSRNRIRSEDLLNQMQLDGFTEIHLEENALESLDGWKFPSTMRYLSLKGNGLKMLPSSLMNFIKNQTDFMLLMSGNDKNCTCERRAFKTFLTEHHKFVGDIDDILCQVNNNGTTSFLPLVSTPDSELCKTDVMTSSQKTMIVVLCSSFAFLLSVLVFYYKQRQLILSFLYIHFDVLSRLCFGDQPEDDGRMFDAFVAYSSQDRNVVMELLRELEDKPPHFRLCIHERNWLPGRFICDNILSSVQSSRRTIVVLSRSFLASPWFNLELRAAVSRLSRDKVCRIIVIMTDKSVALEGIDPELRHIISKRTYLVWQERWFWEKLRYAMPRRKPLQEESSSASGRGRRRDSEISLMMEAV